MKFQPPTINTPNEYAKLFPRPPLLSSCQTQWQRISMVYTHQAAHDEFPEVQHSLHAIAIFTTPCISEWTIDGTTQINSNTPGDIVLVPAHVKHSTRWQSDAKIVAIGLENSLFAEAIAVENAKLFDKNTQQSSSQLVPQFSTADPLVYQLGLSLKSELERDPMGSRLYAETTAAMLTVHLLQYYSYRP